MIGKPTDEPNSGRVDVITGVVRQEYNEYVILGDEGETWYSLQAYEGKRIKLSIEVLDETT